MDGFMEFYTWWGESFFGADGLHLAGDLVVFACCVRTIESMNNDE